MGTIYIYIKSLLLFSVYGVSADNKPVLKELKDDDDNQKQYYYTQGN